MDKIIFIVGNRFNNYAEIIFNDLLQNGYKPDLIIFNLPDYDRIKKLPNKSKLTKIVLTLGVLLVPLWLLRFISKKFIPLELDTKIVYCKGINTRRTENILINENPRLICVYSCGILSKRICEIFHNTIINVHAGKLPDYRGVNNIEWAYYEEQELWGTVQFTSEQMDKGDIIYEECLTKVIGKTTINQIREQGFSEVYSLFSKAIRQIFEGKRPWKQPNFRTNRYKLHAYLKEILIKNLNNINL